MIFLVIKGVGEIKEVPLTPPVAFSSSENPWSHRHQPPSLPAGREQDELTTSS
jgi:hypothetical protein